MEPPCPTIVSGHQLLGKATVGEGYCLCSLLLWFPQKHLTIGYFVILNAGLEGPTLVQSRMVALTLLPSSMFMELFSPALSLSLPNFYFESKQSKSYKHQQTVLELVKLHLICCCSAITLKILLTKAMNS